MWSRRLDYTGVSVWLGALRSLASTKMRVTSGNAALISRSIRETAASTSPALRLSSKSRLSAADSAILSELARCYCLHTARAQAACQGVDRQLTKTTGLHRTMAKVCKSDGQGTFAGTQGNGEVAPIPVVCVTK